MKYRIVTRVECIEQNKEYSMYRVEYIMQNREQNIEQKEQVKRISVKYEV